MQAAQANFSPQVDSVLSRYQQWKKLVIDTIDKPVFDKTYVPEVIEVFDQHGLLAGRVHGKFSYDCARTGDEESEFTAWFIDGELAVFYVGEEIVINRLGIGSWQSAVGSRNGLEIK
jgi:hypothetical protein